MLREVAYCKAVWERNSQIILDHGFINLNYYQQTTPQHLIQIKHRNCRMDCILVYYEACKTGKLDIVKYIIKYIIIGFYNNSFIQQGMQYAAENQHYNICRYLIEKGHEPSYKLLFNIICNDRLRLVSIYSKDLKIFLTNSKIDKLKHISYCMLKRLYRNGIELSQHQLMSMLFETHDPKKVKFITSLIENQNSSTLSSEIIKVKARQVFYVKLNL